MGCVGECVRMARVLRHAIFVGCLCAGGRFFFFLVVEGGCVGRLC